MKHLLSLLFVLIGLSSQAQTPDTLFNKQWQEIDSLLSIQNLPKSALYRVDVIYTQAKKRNIPAQFIKALLYKLSLQNKVSETDINNNISDYYKEIAGLNNAASQSILQVLLAETLSNYYNNNQWRINGRNATNNFKKEDVTTWGKDDFFLLINTLYTNALAPKNILQQTQLQAYTAIIIRGTAQKLRPTLYDLLANMAINFYKQQAGSQTKPVNAFTLNDSAALAPYKVFANHNFITADTTSFLLKALQLYQQLIQLHSAHNDSAALIDADINRITWVHDNAYFPNKDSAYTTALTSITQQYANYPQVAQAWYLLFILMNDKANKYDAFRDTANRYLLAIIRQQIKERLAAQPAPSEGNTNMQQLLQQIEAKELHTQAEAVNIPGQPFRILVQYKNVDAMYYRLLDKKLADKVKLRNDSTYWNEMTTLVYTKSFTQPFPLTSDYRPHKAEIKIDALPAGQYVLLASNNKNFSDTERLLVQDVIVSHLAYINKGDDYYVVDRESGRPLPGVSAKANLHYYNNRSRVYEDKQVFNGSTDKQGHFALAPKEKNELYGNVFITLTDGKDVYNSNENTYYRSTGNDDRTIAEDDAAHIHLYTDRAIYRPGQKVFFKGIATTQNTATKLPKLYLAKDSLLFYLQDVNSKNIDSLRLKVNEYGSVTGSFILPLHGLTGSFSISSDDIEGEINFRVEEYKRPTFYVQLDTLKSAYKLGDSITVTGFAQAFAGNFLNNAAVKYSVNRNTRYNIYDWNYYGKRFPPRNYNGQQIADGTVTTDGSGKYSFTFLAQPDETADTTTNPIFDYAISIAVTDAGGETREANTSLSVGYTSSTVNITLPAAIEQKQFTSIPVSVENLGGKPIKANVHIIIYPLLSPGRAVHARYWDRPDVFVMNKEDFIKNFPYDEYKNESDVHTWQKDNALVSDTFSANNSKAYNIKQAVIPQGWYAVEATTTDKDGRAVKAISYTQVYNSATAAMPSTNDKFEAADKTVLHTGDKASLQVGSSFTDVYVLQQAYKQTTGGGKISIQPVSIIKLDNNKQLIQLPVTEADRGGFGLYYAFIKHNRFYTGGQWFSVPFDNKDLDIQYTTYRNKTEPGSKEQWIVKVKSNDSSNKPAELLTAMYDASLDEFTPHSWEAPTLWPSNYYSNNWSSQNGFNIKGSEDYTRYLPPYYFDKTYPQLATSIADIEAIATERLIIKMHKSSSNLNDVVVVGYGIQRKQDVTGAVSIRGLAAPTMESRLEGKTAGQTVMADSDKASAGRFTYMLGFDANEAGSSSFQPPLQLRTNFNETAFFFPQLQPDSTGNYSISFTMPESLTQWKWLALAHTKDLAFGSNETTITTQKTLMVQPNMPRFLREGDQLEITARISNTGDTALTGTAELQLIDASTGNPVDGSFHNVFPNQYFTAEAGQSATVKFPVAIPFNYTKPLTYRITARAAGFNDGEENTLPVLTNRMLVTESLPLYVKGDTTKHFTFDKLLNNKSETLQTQSLTVEYTVNPIWNAIQALPYLIEYPYECAEQTFNRFYANALSANIMQQHPRIKQVFDAWRNDTSALQSNLEKNQELKQVLLEETPWVLNAENEAQQKKNIALLLDMAKMADGAQSALQKLQDMQLPDGGFAWFKGGYADRYITQYILTGIGRLQQLNAVPQANNKALNTLVSKALTYLDKSANDDYKVLVKNKVNLNTDNLSQTAIQYLFMRSYFSTIAIADKTGYNYYYQQAMKYWQRQSEYMKGMISMALLRTNQQAFVAAKIYPSIMENAVTTKEKGMYWKNAAWGYYWYQSPIEQQALLIELAEGLHKKADANEMRTWLINQKQTTNWKTTKATADAVFALLLNNSTMVDANRNVTIQLGGYTISNATEKAEAGTGYIKQVIPQANVTPAMGNVTVAVQTEGSNKNSNPSYGAVYWQYFEDMDKITQATTSLSLHKKLFVENTTASGKVLTPVDADSALHVGNKVIIRVELKTDRDLEYIHLKDMRVSSMEPVNVLSEYKWQDGLGYYESTKDVATDFFISYMPKGTYVFEYPVYITHKGTFSAGIATVQCMYAPEFSSHSEGIKVEVE